MAEFVEVMNQKLRMCNYFKQDCNKCNLSYKANGLNVVCTKCLSCYPEEAEKIIMDWAKEHPIVTNKDKFREVFGFELGSISLCDEIPCPYEYTNDDCHDCDNCQFRGFWEKEYKEPKGENV